MSLLFALTHGYYHPSRRAGLSRFAALMNAVRLAWRCRHERGVA